VTIRVLWLVKGLGPGGAERLLVEQAAVGDRSTFAYEAAYVLDWKQHLVPELEAEHVRTHCFDVRSELDPRWIVRLTALLRRERYDVVHAHSPFVAAFGRLVNRALPRDRRAAFVYTEHNRWPSYRRETRLANRVTFGLNDATFAVSDDVRASMPARRRRDVEVLVHGIDVARVREAAAHRDRVRAELGVGPDEHLAVTVANLRAGKNYPGLLAAAS
jgi:L-malate glycosyltransferase